MAHRPTGHRLAAAAASARRRCASVPFLMLFEFRKAKFTNKKRHASFVRINVSATIQGLYLISANAHFDCGI